MIKICTCEKWKPNMDKINSYIFIGYIHGCNEYDGEQFIYCPFCGNKLVLEEGEKNHGREI